MARARRRADAEAGSAASAPSVRAATGAPTLRDVAKAAGVSQSTVSRVLSGAPTTIPIAAATRERVLAAAKRLGYRPNPLARGLTGAQTMLLGAVIRDITDPSFPAIIEAVTSEAKLHSYDVVLGHAQGTADEALELWGVLESRHCDAILLLGDLGDQPGLIESLESTREPVVALWHGSRSTVLPTVNVDNRSAIMTVMEHLVSLGHERIAFVGRRQLGDIVERAAAYEEFTEGQGWELRPGYLQEAVNEYEGGMAALERLMALPEPPTAVVGATDVLGLGVMHAALQRGLRVPQDLSVTGVDDIPATHIVMPPLTTMRMPVRSMVKAAIDIAIESLGPSPDPNMETHPVFEAELVVRGSTGSPAEARRASA
jgi:DNA-binding LacI/PurR family transcriptional regulator